MGQIKSGEVEYWADKMQALSPFEFLKVELEPVATFVPLLSPFPDKWN